MDYEKKYKEALERFKTFREKYCTYGDLHFGDVIFDKTGEAQKDLDAIFPELKESEDERIRKEINTLYSDIDTCISELLKARIDKDSEAEGKALFKMEGLMVGTLQDLSCIEDYLEKQKEPHYTKRNALFDKCVANCDPEIMKEVSDEIDSQLKKEPKQEWSEEDEKMLKDLIHDLWVISESDYPDNENLKKELNWLKSRRPSKDCSSCAKHLEGYISGRSDAENKLLEQFGALITPEGELHIKPRWKPSEEQIKALYCALNDAISLYSDKVSPLYEEILQTHFDALESLYNDLKKL